METWLPAPETFGFNAERFPDWRVDQPPAIKAVLESEKRYCGLVLPTGAGKSATYMAIPQITGWRTAILTSTKALQDQLSRDFDGLVTVLKGQSAYPCYALAPGGELASWNPTGDAAHCGEGPCHAGIRCSLKGSQTEASACAYFKSVQRAMKSKVVVTNYACWLAHRIHAGGLGAFDCLVLDEAHASPDELASALRVEIAQRDLKALGAAPWPKADYEKDAGWQKLLEWASALNSQLRHQMDVRKPESASETRHYMIMKRVANALDQLIHADRGITLVREVYNKLSVDPIWAGAHSDLLFGSVKKIICTSATVTPKTMELVGVGEQETTWYESQGSFLVKRRPIYLLKTARVDNRMSDGDRQWWMSQINDILRSRPDWKGIIHTVSYERRDYIMKNCDFPGRLISHSKDDTARQVAAFKASDAPLVMVSPSLTTGYDFPYDECRFQIVTKVPFPDTRDPITARRSILDPDYGGYVAMQQLMQMAGRGMRAPDDSCETFVIDDHARWFLAKFKRFARRWFLNAVSNLDMIPPAPRWG